MHQIGDASKKFKINKKSFQVDQNCIKWTIIIQSESKMFQINQDRFNKIKIIQN